MNPLAALGWVDLTLLAVLAVSVVVGLWRGLVFELMALAGWLVAYVAAQVAAPQVAPSLPVGEPGSALPQGAAFALTFLGVLIGWAILARLLRLLVHATPLTLIDRVLGAGFGLLRGAVLLLAVSTVVALTPAARSQPWQDSVGAAWLGAALQGIKPVLPDDVARHLPA
ncbi:MAG: CvpA family protein [Burkholderiaceae bacterium]|nr:CvpA family protein [Burkholderiaceae bacterium]